MKGINTSVYSVTGQTAQAYKTPSIKIDIPKQTRVGAYQQMRRENEATQFRQKVDDFVLTKINDLPEDYAAEKLPPAVQNSIQPIILSARQQYADSARLLAGMKGQVGTPDYLKVMDGMVAYYTRRVCFCVFSKKYKVISCRPFKICWNFTHYTIICY